MSSGQGHDKDNMHLMRGETCATVLLTIMMTWQFTLATCRFPFVSCHLPLASLQLAHKASSAGCPQAVIFSVVVVAVAVASLPCQLHAKLIKLCCCARDRFTQVTRVLAAPFVAFVTHEKCYKLQPIKLHRFQFQYAR